MSACVVTGNWYVGHSRCTLIVTDVCRPAGAAGLRTLQV